MRKWLRWIALTPLLLLAGVIVTAQLLRLFAVGDDERAAVALVEVPPPALTGSNGFAALALLDYEVPLAGVDAAIAVEVDHFNRWLQGSGKAIPAAQEDSRDDAAVSLPRPHNPADRWPRRASLKAEGLACKMSAADCLDAIRANPGPVRALLAREAPRLAGVDAALAADHFRSPYPAVYEAPLPPYQALRLPLMQAALDAVDGRVPASLARSCRLLSSSRRFAREATDLVGRGVFDATAEGAATLMMRVRQEHPGVAMPADCAEALAPVRPEDHLVCQAVRGEFQYTMSLTRRISPTDSWLVRDLLSRLVLVDDALMEAWVAARHAEPCTEAFRAEVLAGVVPTPVAPRIGPDDPTCYGAYLTCVVSAISGTSFEVYQRRMLDHAAKLRLILASMAAADGTLTREAALRQAASPGYPLAVDSASGTVGIELKWKPRNGPDPVYRVPLAP